MSEANYTPKRIVAITPSDTTRLEAGGMLGIRAGSSGVLVLKGENGSALAGVSVPVSAGDYIPGSFSMVMAASTATGNVALYRQ